MQINTIVLLLLLRLMRYNRWNILINEDRFCFCASHGWNTLPAGLRALEEFNVISSRDWSFCSPASSNGYCCSYMPADTHLFKSVTTCRGCDSKDQSEYNMKKSWRHLRQLRRKPSPNTFIFLFSLTPHLFEGALHVDALVPRGGGVSQAVAGVPPSGNVHLLPAQVPEGLGHHHHPIVRQRWGVLGDRRTWSQITVCAHLWLKQQVNIKTLH